VEDIVTFNVSDDGIGFPENFLETQTSGLELVRIMTRQLKGNVEFIYKALYEFLKELKSIKGYKASAIMSDAGKVLASDTSDEKMDLELVAATFNDIFRSAHEACDKIGLGSCNESTIRTPKGVIIMRCSGSQSEVHFHAITILEEDGNQALMKLNIEKFLQKMKY